MLLRRGWVSQPFGRGDLDQLVGVLGATPPEPDAGSPDLRKSRLPDGRTISVRPKSSGKSGGKPTIQIDGPKTGGVKSPPHEKVRYNTHGG